MNAENKEQGNFCHEGKTYPFWFKAQPSTQQITMNWSFTNSINFTNLQFPVETYSRDFTQFQPNWTLQMFYECCKKYSNHSSTMFRKCYEGNKNTTLFNVVEICIDNLQ